MSALDLVTEAASLIEDAKWELEQREMSTVKTVSQWIANTRHRVAMGYDTDKTISQYLDELEQIK